MTIKYTELPQNIPNGRKKTKYLFKNTNILRSKTLQILPKLGFWLENIPSGNPGDATELRNIDLFQRSPGTRQSIFSIKLIVIWLIIEGNFTRKKLVRI
jgi:hypothetical protein